MKDSVISGLTGGRTVELSAGDALLVPRGWWHYVQNVDPLNIALNIWLPHVSAIKFKINCKIIIKHLLLYNFFFSLILLRGP